MKQFLTIVLCAMALLAASIGFHLIKTANSPATMPQAVNAPRAGAPNGAQPGMGGGPMMDANFQKTHKYTLQLVTLVNNVARLEQDGKSPLSGEQAKKMLAVLNPLRQKPSLDENSAKDGIIAIQNVLTDAQRTAISGLPEEKQFQRPPQPPAGGTSGPPAGQPGAPPPGGPGMGAGKMGEMNPLNPPQGGPGAAGPDGGPGAPPGADRVQKLIDSLGTKSGTK